MLAAEHAAGSRVGTTWPVASTALPSVLARALTARCIGLSASPVERQSDQKRDREAQGTHGLDTHDAILMPGDVINTMSRYCIVSWRVAMQSC